MESSDSTDRYLQKIRYPYLLEKGWLGIFLEINKRADPNKRGGWKNFQNLIKGVFQIKMSQVEKCPKINKRVTSILGR